MSSFQLLGMAGWLAAAAVAGEADGRQVALVSLAVSQTFPDGALDGTVAHWGLARVDKKSGWEHPAPGWLSEPDHSKAAGVAPPTLACFGNGQIAWCQPSQTWGGSPLQLGCIA